MSPSRLSMWASKTVLVPNHQTGTSPSALWRCLLLMVLDHPQGIQKIWAHWGPVDPLDPREAVLVLGDCRQWAVKNQNWPKVPELESFL
ncbi:hypothetical protein O181_013430 [Austropuccinia psidii MF-1]|uniref:Uncharacterized protein n=1 Tax=Austropuccinia psidii MF-1 TaxID=1389203 RepID=A0A9Q3BZV3_9BASI|nr:hypothetical protein [Austropuccinia psidii MF-1]